MMKVVGPKEMARVEKLAYAAGASEADYMERAGAGVAYYIEEYVRYHRMTEHVTLLCGKGNNGGDAFVAGRYLLQKGFEVTAIQLVALDECSPLCQDNAKRFGEAGGLTQLYVPSKPVSFPVNGVIVDGIFGTGFKGPAGEPYASLIRQANQSGLPILAVDIPSGLDGASGVAEGDVIKASETIFLGLPKTGFFLLDGWNHVGRLRHVDFGLAPASIEAAEPDLLLPGPADWSALIPPIQRDHHKYQKGYVVGLAGSPGMPGAAIMSSFAALRGGAGIVKLLHPEGMQSELVGCPAELIRVPYQLDHVEPILTLLNAASATFVGPGIGRVGQTQQLLATVLAGLTKPAVIDADALTLIAECELTPPPNSVLTPHRGEMARLLGMATTPPLTMPFLLRCQEYVEKYQITLVLKGGTTFILHPGVAMRVSARGDPGMATAGSGDVLTGLLAALLSQGMKPLDAATLGVALHSIAGEYAAREKTSYCVVAWDILEAIPNAYASLLQHA